MYPTKRDDLLLKEIDNELLVYDLRRHQAHCLNRVAALVLSFCDGKTSLPVMARKLQQDLGTEVDEAMVVQAIQRLHRAQLLSPGDLTEKISRRRLTKKLAAAGAAAVIISITAPAAAMAASGITQARCQRLRVCTNQNCTDQPGKRCQPVGPSVCDCQDVSGRRR